MTRTAATRTATLRTESDEAEILASSVRPDNTPEIDTRVEEGDGADGAGSEIVVTTVERETTGGLRTTVDDYVVNLAVAQEVVQIANRRASANADRERANQNADDTETTQNP